MATNTEQLVENAYSYRRISRSSQSKGVGLNRQDDNAVAVCKEKGWTLVPKTLVDLGYSASKGENLFRLDAALKWVIDASISGKLLPNPVLIIDDFSRFSRLDIDQSEPQFLDLLRAGVAIWNNFNKRLYTKASTKDAMARIEIILGFKMAFDYTDNLSKKVNDAFARKYKHASEGTPVQLGSWQPAWVDFIGEKKSVGKFQLNGIAEIMRGIVLDYLNGKSMLGIAKRLNKEKTPCIGKGTRKGKRWSQGQIGGFLRSELLVGTADINGHRFDHYYPQVITDDEWKRLQTKLNDNQKRKGGTRTGDWIANLFPNRCVCSNCKGHITTSQGRNARYYMCLDSRLHPDKCEVRRMLNIQDIEEDFFLLFLKQYPSELIGKNTIDFQTKIANVNARIKDVEREQEDASQLLGKFPVKALEKKFGEIQSQMDQLVKERDELKRQMTTATNAPDAITSIKKALKVMEKDGGYSFNQSANQVIEALKSPSVRKQLLQLIPSIVECITIDMEAGSYAITTKDGNTTSFRSVVELPTID